MIQKRRNKKKISDSLLLCRGIRFIALIAACFTAAVSSFSLPCGQRKAVAERSAPQTSFLSSSSSALPCSESLFLPGSYEEYLALENPSSVAVTENYTAIADGFKIYVYDRAENKYRYYTHQDADTQITQLKFDDANTLYFSEQSNMRLYAYNLQNSTVTDTGISCSAFDIYRDELYYTTISNTTASIFKKSLSALSRTETLEKDVRGKPAIAHNGETLYYTFDYWLASIGHDTAQKIATTSVQSLSFNGDYCFYTDTNKSLYDFRYAEAGAQPEIIAENCVSVSSPYDGFIYVVGDKKIRQLNTETREFTSYEISSTSASQGRIYAATDTTLCGDKLITLDKGDSEKNVPARIHVSNTLQAEQSGQTTRSFALSDLSGTAKLIASDGETACVVSDVASTSGESGALTVYDLSYQKPIFTYSSEVGETFLGVACVYGTYYAVSKTRFYTLAPTAQPLVETESSQEAYAVTSHTSPHANVLLSCDVYGMLYVAQSDNKVYAYSESEFVSESGVAANTAAILPQSAGSSVKPSKLLVDFNRNIYVLQGGAIVQCAASTEVAPVTYTMNDKSFVYAQTPDTPVVSATFGVENGATYVIYNGNFIAATYDISLPTVNTVRINGVDETLFSQSAAQFCVTECSEKTLLLRIDLAAVKNAEYFPCISYGRTKNKISAISLAETERYALLAVYDKETNDYYTALAEKSSCTNVSEAEFLAPSPEPFQSGAKGYVTNAISLYKYPYLTPLLTVCPLDRNAEVTVLKTVQKLDWIYYQIEYTNENGVTQTGFLPSAYVSDTNGAAPQSQTATFGGESNNRDLVWRLVYIILGTLVVCILTDYLILRKHDKE